MGGGKESSLWHSREQSTECTPDNHDSLRLELLGALAEVVRAVELVEHTHGRVPLWRVVLLLRLPLRHYDR